jgi:hypothetical protein
VGQYTEVFVGLDVAKLRHAVAVADGDRNGEVDIWARSTRILPPSVDWSHVCGAP